MAKELFEKNKKKLNPLPDSSATYNAYRKIIIFLNMIRSTTLGEPLRRVVFYVSVEGTVFTIETLSEVS